MDSKQESPFLSRPIILSPPPLSGKEDSKLKEFLASGHFQRQQSVGYNLQHEFETLNADLDLDLKDNYQPNSNFGTNSQEIGANPGTAASTQPEIMGDSFVNSPVPTNINGSQAGLGSLLNQSFYLPLNLPHRPQTVTDFSVLAPPASLQFYPELLRFTSWIENLSPADSATMIEYLCTNLPVDILLSFRSKLDQQLSGYNSILLPNLGAQAQHQPQPQPLNRMGQRPMVGLSLVLSPYAYAQNQQQDLLGDLDQLNLNDDKILQPKPRQNAFKQFPNMGFQTSNPSLAVGGRPRSADPSFQQKLQQNQLSNQPFNGYQFLDRAKLPTNHMFEKTNFLQLAAAHSPGLAAQQSLDEYESLDMSQKLGALATINSRVALDSNKKGWGHHDPTNRSVNSSSVPVGGNKVKLPNQKARKEPTAGTSASNSSMPADVTSLELLNNIPAWLKLLRLHKYTEALKDIPWKDLIELSDEQLEEKGVKALGARRKLLKAFDVIKNHFKA